MTYTQNPVAPASEPESSEDNNSTPFYNSKQARKAGISAFVGTTIEWYDFYIYGTASALVLGKLFFPDVSPAMGTLAAFATFAVGFIARPLGGIVFGHFGDLFGRKNAVVITLILMGVGTVGVGLLPTYDMIGIWAPILLVLLRLIQGIAMGGEWGGAVLIATESAPKDKKILYGAFAQQGSPVGNLLATATFLLLTFMSDQVFESWGWRIPFVASIVLVAVSLYIRLKVTETPEMQQLAKNNEKQKTPIVEVFRNHWGVVLLGIGSVVAGVALTYIKTTFALSWATADLNYDRSTFLTVITFALIVQCLVQPFGAILASKIDIRKAMVWMLLPEVIFLPLMFLLINTGQPILAALGMALATVPHSMYYAALAGTLAQVFPTAIRYTGISVAYQGATAIFAGTAPYLSQYLLMRFDSIMPVVVLGVFYSVLSLVCMQILLSRSSAFQSTTQKEAA
ncbi:MFS transporter [Corynebacterium sp. S7]